MRSGPVGLIVVLLASSASPEPLEAIRKALARHPGTSGVEASVHVAVQVQGGDEGERRSGEIEVRATHGPTGLRVSYPPSLLERLRAEDASSSEEGPDLPASDVLSELGAGALDEALDFAGPLAHLIEGASVLREGAADGEQPAWIELRAHPSRAARPPYVKESELIVTLWLADDGVPSAVATDSRVTAGRFLINVTQAHRVRRELARVGDRLVVVRSQGELDVSGLGQSFRRTVEIEIRPYPSR